ncbi:pleckstrin homology domain-containing family G member 4B-like, partial [Sitophilus oryzae]|uniref:Pleckstrin homology domain-containing family G member 4B-like n=1 Tax=Sitophilus oryzae TaxID=7048 RepID=A0A6J2Y108_SITOR
MLETWEELFVTTNLFPSKSHPDLCRTIFGNLQHIYDRQNQFCHALANCRLDQNLIARVFIDYETLFDLYPRYFKGTPRSNAAVKRIHEDLKKRQEELQNKLGLAAYILTPVQRLGKYKLLLENIIKELKKNNETVGSVEMALDIIKKYMRKGNDAVAVGSIMNSTIKNYGSFIMREKFALMKPRRLDVVVFLFELVVVITVEVQNDKEQFMFYKCIYTNDLRIATFNNNTIHLTDFAKEKKTLRLKYTYVLDARLPKIKDTWKHEIEKILWNQLNNIKGTYKLYSYLSPCIFVR